MTMRPDEDPYRRLSDAVELYLGQRASGTPQDPAELLANNPELRDLLEPMLEAAEAGPSTVESPRFFGDFELVREIGRGGIGVVYEAREVALERRIALKLLPDGPHLTPQRIERFRREAAAAGRLQHEGLAAVFRVGEHDGTHFIAMELVDGDDLAVVLDRLCRETDGRPDRLTGTPFGMVDGGGYFADTAELVARVGEALAFAHSNGVVHRDIKPHNLLLGGSAGIKIVDFGLAKDFAREALTQTGDTAGTPEYMSPEQVRGEAVDARTDVYSLGVVLYELLTLTRPFRSDVIHDTLRAVVERDPLPVRKIRPEVPRDLETICHRALEKDPARRYSSAADMVEDLRRFRRHEPILASPASTLTRTLRLVRRHRAASLAIVFAVLALVVAPLAFAIHFKSARDEIAAEERETARQRDLAAAILVQARGALDDVYSWLARDRLLAEPGLVDVRRELMKRTVGFYEVFRGLAAGDENLQLEALFARIRLAGILRDMGKLPEAEEHLGSVLEALEHLDPEIAESDALRLDRSRVHRWLVMFLLNRGRIEEAREHLDAALALVNQPGSTIEWSIETGEVFEIEARMQMQYGGGNAPAVAALDRAVAAFEAALAARQAADKPDSPTTQKLLAGALTVRGQFRARSGSPADGIADMERAFVLMESVFEQRPRAVDVRRTFARMLGSMSEVRIRSRDFAAAQTLCERGLEIAESLHQDFPELVSYRFAVVDALYELATVFLAKDDLAAALPLLERAWPMIRGIVQEMPSQVPAVSMMATIASPLAVARSLVGGASVESTFALHQEAVDSLETILSDQPNSHAARSILATTLDNFGGSLRRAREFERGRQVLRRSVELHTELRRADPADPMVAKNFGSSFINLISLELQAGQFADAMTLSDELVTALPDNALVLFNASRFAAVAAADTLEGAERAEDYATRAMRWLTRTVELDPGYAERLAGDSAYAAIASRPEFRAIVGRD